MAGDTIMATVIEIDGVGRVEMDDGFKNLSPAQQNEIVQNIVNSMQPKPAPQRLRAAAQGLTLGASDEIEAAFRSLMPGQTYDAALEDARSKLKAYQKESPIGSLAYEAGGAMIPAIGAMLAAPFTGGTSAAVTAPTIGRIAATAAAQGAGYAFNTGEGGFGSRSSRVPGGAALGAAGGVVGTGIAKAAGGAVNKLVDATRRVVGGRGATVVENEIQRLVRQTGKSADEIADDIMAGRILAENETIKAAVRAYRAGGGEASTVITQGMTQRPAQTRAAAMNEIRSYLTDASTPSAVQAQRASEDAAKIAERASYAPFRNMDAPQPVVEELAGALKRVPGAVDEVATILRAQTGAAPFFKVLDDGSVEFTRMPTVAEAESIRRAISNKANALYMGGQGGAGEAVKEVERGLRGLLDQEVPSLSAARATASGVRSQRDAFEAGRKALSGDVNEKLGEFSKLTDPDQVDAYRAGLMSALEARSATGTRQSMIRNLANEETKEGRIIREVLPQGSVDDVMKSIETARASQVTTDYVLGGSPTSDTLLEQARRGAGFSVSDITGAFRADPGSMARIASNFADRFTRDLTDAEKARVARILVSQDANLVKQAIVDNSALAALQKRVEEIVAAGVKGSGRAGSLLGSSVGSPASENTIKGLLAQ
jgi:hypothetical protein